MTGIDDNFSSIAQQLVAVADPIATEITAIKQQLTAITTHAANALKGVRQQILEWEDRVEFLSTHISSNKVV